MFKKKGLNLVVTADELDNKIGVRLGAASTKFHGWKVASAGPGTPEFSVSLMDIIPEIKNKLFAM